MKNIIYTERPKNTPLPHLYKETDINPDFLHDESRLEGKADCAVIPSDTLEVSAVMKFACENDIDVTVSGGRTGIAGGAVPDGGILMSLSGMRKIYGLSKDELNGETTIKCQAGTLLSDLRSYLVREKTPFFFPPDPTEDSATIGGMIACNASGAHTFKYGPTRNYVKSITAVLANGDIIRLKRTSAKGEKPKNKNRKNGKISGIPFIISFPDGRESRGRLPEYESPQTKNAAGYYSSEEMELIDLIIGSEGTLAVVTEAELLLLPKPEREFNALFFLKGENAAVELTNALRSSSRLDVTAIEYFDYKALNLLRKRRRELGAASGIPPGMPDDPETTAIYADLTSNNEDIADDSEILFHLSENLKSGPAVKVWAAFDSDERERLRKFRHALPETVNSIIALRRKDFPEITKLGTDMAVGDKYLAKILSIYRSDLDKSGLEYVIFGHIGNNHLHVNILPRDLEEYDLGKRMYFKFAGAVIKMKGSISAEHGIGKLKKDFLKMMLKEEGLREMANIKKIFDPEHRLNPETLI